jgi:hypothetical protein
MKIVIPDDYQDTIHKLDAFKLLAGHEVSPATASQRAISMSWSSGCGRRNASSKSASGSIFRAL